ncbi:PLP-dependent aminotransferase family protein [Palleronia sp. LCG004]|uniref:MocR-like pyridoxine biosynthesis transcription factor PdxR n=1 Tax=Palleronia sp. LCG004 TaxID=3079304 RepID=UPI002942704D|nr:PLP-dependent aminotransferase family protein [Palleronia sp. LCG004]WOI57840.1 PLP-dependent aminotransferase family protein [Palleronia sp. LCG004]
MTKPLSLPLICRPDREGEEPLAVQLYRDLLAAIRDGRLGQGHALPSSRAAAGELGLARSTVTVAYDLLRAEGAIEMRRGAAPRVVTAPVAPGPAVAMVPRAVSGRGARMARNPRRETGPAQGVMAPGEPDEGLFPADEWARALRRAARRRHGGAFAYAEPWGIAPLRRILSERLRADRGIAAEPDRIVVTTGTQGGLSLIARLMTEPGERAAIEDPGYLGARVAFEGAGLVPVPVPVDAEGIVVEAVPRDVRLVYLTPSNQYPTGVRLSHARRAALVRTARETGALILEDDYDSEFLWRGREIAALSAEAGGGEAIHFGSASKVLAPALRIGWMVVPGDLVDPVRAALRNQGLMANLHAQWALAEMMESGRYRAQARRIARAYEGRGRALCEALGPIGGLSVRPPDGGVQLAVRFDDGRSEEAAIHALGRGGFRPARLSAYCMEAGARGLVVGFADATPERIARFARILGTDG